MLDLVEPTASLLRVAVSEFVPLILVRAAPPAEVLSACASAILI